MLSGNKGEWSEIYTLLKLIGDKKLYSGDAELKKLEDVFYPIIKIIRHESGNDFEYLLDGDIVVITSGTDPLRIPIKKFQTEAISLLKQIKDSNGVFRIPTIEAFLKSISCNGLKAKSTKKSDIQIVIHDIRLNQQVELGFSIKSQLGGDSTLLNAGKTTNFIYKIEKFNPDKKEINRINNIDTRSKVKDRLEAIKKGGGVLKFVAPEQNIFKNNLVLIDSLLPDIISEVVRTFYTSSVSSIRDLTAEVNKRNPLKYDIQNAHMFYDYKIKRFLTDVALGMMPSKVWAGEYDATGGYLIVKENGDVLCYHIYNRNQFEDYLFNNTKLETASTTRHDFGTIYRESETLYLKLNLQIRFK